MTAHHHRHGAQDPSPPRPSPPVFAKFQCPRAIGPPLPPRNVCTFAPAPADRRVRPPQRPCFSECAGTRARYRRERAAAPHSFCERSVGRKRARPRFRHLRGQRDVRSPVADDDRREVPRFLQSGARDTAPRKFWKQGTRRRAARTRLARKGRRSPSRRSRAPTSDAKLATSRTSRLPRVTPASLVIAVLSSDSREARVVSSARVSLLVGGR
jgi:hypothetical protein